jgi:hypothetical protein
VSPALKLKGLGTSSSLRQETKISELRINIETEKSKVKGVFIKFNFNKDMNFGTW